MSDHNTPFEALSDGDRLLAFACLEETETSVPIETLAARVAAARADIPPADVTDDERRAVAIRLYHVHLPKLDAAGLVSFDCERRRVTRSSGNAAERTAEFIEQSTV
jgi:hypothetical protein